MVEYFTICKQHRNAFLNVRMSNLTQHNCRKSSLLEAILINARLSNGLRPQLKFLFLSRSFQHFAIDMFIAIIKIYFLAHKNIDFFAIFFSHKVSGWRKATMSCAQPQYHEKLAFLCMNRINLMIFFSLLVVSGKLEFFRATNITEILDTVKVFAFHPQERSFPLSTTRSSSYQTQSHKNHYINV